MSIESHFKWQKNIPLKIKNIDVPAKKVYNTKAPVKIEIRAQACGKRENMKDRVILHTNEIYPERPDSGRWIAHGMISLVVTQ